LVQYTIYAGKKKTKEQKGIPKYLFSIFFSLFLTPGYIKWEIRGIWVEVVGWKCTAPLLSSKFSVGLVKNGIHE